MSEQDWVDSNVHSWSARMSGVLDLELPDLPRESVEAAESTQEVAEIKSNVDQTLHPIVDKIFGRRGCLDRDLRCVDPFGMLVLTWRGLKGVGDMANAGTVMSDFLRDIGGTCLQGDTHRLFSVLLTIRRR